MLKIEKHCDECATGEAIATKSGVWCVTQLRLSGRRLPLASYERALAAQSPLPQPPATMSASPRCRDTSVIPIGNCKQGNQATLFEVEVQISTPGWTMLALVKLGKNSARSSQETEGNDGLGLFSKSLNTKPDFVACTKIHGRFLAQTYTWRRSRGDNVSRLETHESTQIAQ